MIAINEVALAKLLAENNTKDYFLLSPQDHDYEYEEESDLYEDEECTIYWDVVQTVFDEFFNYYLTTMLEFAGWVCTDPSCNQFRFEVSPKVFKFREDRTVNPETGETKVYETEIDLDDYTYVEMFDAYDSFGYSEEEFEDWYKTGAEWALIAECLFELDMDAWIM